MIKVSVIIPVYNSEKYLRQCLDSVINQTLKDIEIICIDDGSTDQSVAILEEYQLKDPRIEILHQQHSSAGVARNNGMAVSNGKYLVFWDSDDYYFPTALEDMFFQCEKDAADVCICGGRQYYDQQGFEAPAPRYLRKKEIPDSVPFNVETAPDNIVSITTESPWNKMFLKQFVLDRELRFQACRNANDVFFVVSALCLAERVTLVNKQLICYRKDKKTGLVATVSDGLINALNAWVDTATFLQEKKRFPERSFANRALESVIYLLNNTSDWESYKQGYLLLQEDNLGKLGILQQEDDNYYYIAYHNEAVRHLYNDTPEQFSKWIGTYLFYKEALAVGRQRSNDEKNRQIIKSKEDSIKTLSKETQKLTARNIELSEQCKEQKNKIDLIKKSKSYKAGEILAWLPRKIRGK